ncbi:MAG: hypothetical protein K6F63_00055, partial [Lachnospiraceae bacterium]|nr:hypothetical protein [Lachnospiraceae bacterium]
ELKSGFVCHSERDKAAVAYKKQSEQEEKGVEEEMFMPQREGGGRGGIKRTAFIKNSQNASLFCSFGGGSRVQRSAGLLKVRKFKNICARCAR